MDLPHTGYREILYIKTKRVSMTIKSVNKVDRFKGDAEPISLLKVDCLDDIEELTVNDKNLEASSGAYRISPTFFEQTQYEVILEGEEKGCLAFWHENKSMREKINRSSKRHEILSGVINFANEVGLSDLYVKYLNEKYLKLTLEVFPTKISYREDYKNIILDITNELYNILFDFMKKTYRGYDQNLNKKNSNLEFFMVLKEIFSELISAVNIVIAHPNHNLQKEDCIVAANKINKVGHKTVKWLSRHPDKVCLRDNHIFVNKVLAEKKYVNWNTKENKVVKHILEKTIVRLEKVKSQYVDTRKDLDPELLEHINDMLGLLKAKIKCSFLNTVDSWEGSNSISWVFLMSSEYRAIYKCSLMLEKALDIAGEVFKVSLKNLAELYEYWCFIKLNSILKNKYDLISQDVVKVEKGKLVISLVKGRNSSIRYRNLANGEIMVLSYNPKIVNLPTVPQRPDNILSLEKKDMISGKHVYEYVFDAKYKIDFADEDSRYSKVIAAAPGPREEDINIMHRYRDSIVSEKGIYGYEREMFGAYVLFPYSDEEKYKAHRFYKSIEKVNIGGLPFLPSATKLVEDLLDDLISASPETAFENTNLPVGTEARLAKIEWSVRDVMIGVVRNKEQFDICKDNRFYYVPQIRIKEDAFPIHYVALYQSEKNFGKNDSGVFYYGEVVKTQLVKRKEITEIPRESEQYYYRFDIKKWEALENPISVKERADIVMYTNLFLLKNSKNISDLRVMSEEEYRLYVELKRLFDVEECNKDGKRYFCYKNYIIDYDGNDVRLIKSRKVIRSIAALLFNRKPNYYFKEVKRIIDNE